MNHLTDDTKEAIGMLLCLAAMVAGPAVFFEWQHRIERERERKQMQNGASPTR